MKMMIYKMYSVTNGLQKPICDLNWESGCQNRYLKNPGDFIYFKRLSQLCVDRESLIYKFIESKTIYSFRLQSVIRQIIRKSAILNSDEMAQY